MAKSGAQAPAEKPEAQKGSATKMPIFLTKFDGSGSDNTDEFRRTLIGHIELQGVAANFYKALRQHGLTRASPLFPRALRSSPAASAYGRLPAPSRPRLPGCTQTT